MNKKPLAGQNTVVTGTSSGTGAAVRFAPDEADYVQGANTLSTHCDA